VVNDADRRTARRHHRRVTIAVTVGLLTMVGAGIFVSVHGYKSTVSGAKDREFNAYTAPPRVTINNAAIDVTADVRSVSPADQTAQVRLRFYPSGRYADRSQSYLVKPVTVSVIGTVADRTEVGGGSPSTYSFAAGQVVPAIDTTVDLVETDAQAYPYDTYGMYLILSVANPDGTNVPSLLAVRNTAEGWTLDSTAQSPKEIPPHTFGYQLEMHRIASTQVYSLFIMALMWALAVAGVFMALTLIRNTDHKIEAGPLTYLAALLFAFPLIRTLLPGDPALGILADFAAYFWVEVVVGMTLFALLVTWIIRERREIAGESDPDPEPAGTAFSDSE